jgi:hypothetical protein
LAAGDATGDMEDAAIDSDPGRLAYTAASPPKRAQLQKIRLVPPAMIDQLLGFEAPKVRHAYLMPFALDPRPIVAPCSAANR